MSAIEQAILDDSVGGIGSSSRGRFQKTYPADEPQYQEISRIIEEPLYKRVSQSVLKDFNQKSLSGLENKYAISQGQIASYNANKGL